MGSWRVVIHSIPDRDSADKLAAAFRVVAGQSVWTEAGGTVTVEPDDVPTAEAMTLQQVIDDAQA